MFVSKRQTFLPSILIIGILSPMVVSTAAAQSFADDFSSNLFSSPGYEIVTEALANPDSVAAVDGSDLLITLVDDDSSNDDQTRWRIQGIGYAPDSIGTTMAFLSRPQAGVLRHDLNAYYFNLTTDGGPNPDEREDDIQIEIQLQIGSNPEDDNATYCFIRRDADGNSQAVSTATDKCFSFLTVPTLNTTYTVTSGVDKTTNELFVQLNDERVTIASPSTEYFIPYRRTFESQVRTRFGAEGGEFRISEVVFGDDVIDLTQVNAARPYRSDDFDDFSNDTDRSKTIVDGRLRLSVSEDNVEEDHQSFLRLQNTTDFVSVDMAYSSESVVDTGAEGFSAIRLAGVAYNEVSDNRDDGFTGSVWTSVMLIENAGTGLVGEYCIIRADNADWTEDTDLADGLDNDRCPTFDLVVQPDTTYSASISIDRIAKTLTFELGGEEKVYNVETEMFNRDDTMGVQSRIARGATGTVVGYFDNLRNDPNAMTDEEITLAMNGENTMASGGSGGCSIVQGRQEYTTLLLLLMAGLFAFCRGMNRRDT